jgi:DNA repair exonuclease SbcCD ATPase subunit
MGENPYEDELERLRDVVQHKTWLIEAAKRNEAAALSKLADALDDMRDRDAKLGKQKLLIKQLNKEKRELEKQVEKLAPLPAENAKLQAELAQLKPAMAQHEALKFRMELAIAELQSDHVAHVGRLVSQRHLILFMLVADALHIAIKKAGAAGLTDKSAKDEACKRVKGANANVAENALQRLVDNGFIVMRNKTWFIA